MAKDPKSKIVGDRRRLLTIHDGARLTPALVRMLDVLADEATEALDARIVEEEAGRSAARTRARSPHYVRHWVDPVLVARSDGLAIYVNWDGELA